MKKEVLGRKMVRNVIEDSKSKKELTSDEKVYIERETLLEGEICGLDKSSHGGSCNLHDTCGRFLKEWDIVFLSLANGRGRKLLLSS